MSRLDPKKPAHPATSPYGHWVQPVILLLFFLSGATGLVYEVAWMRMLTLVFGATSFATATILSSFFTGLAIGSFAIGRLADRSRRPLRLYAILEIGVGASAFLMPLALAGLTELYVWLSHQFAIEFYQFSLIRFVLSFLVLVPPAILMGGTLPVMVRFFVRRQETLGRHVGRLYGLNTLGAVVGSVAAGFFLILFLGLYEAR